MNLDLRWTPFFAALEREIRRFLRVMIQTIFTPLVNSTLYLFIFGLSVGQYIQTESGVSYLVFLIPGLVMMGCLNNAFANSSSSIITAKFGGDLEDFRVSPITHSQIVWAMSIGGVIRGIVVALLTLGTGVLFTKAMTGAWIEVVHPGWLMAYLVLGGLVFAKLGICVAFWAKSFDQLSAVSGFILTPLIYLGGVFFSVHSLSPFWQAVARLNPLLYLINGVRYGLLGTSDVTFEMSLVVTLITVVVFHFLALRSLKTGSFLRW